MDTRLTTISLASFCSFLLSLFVFLFFLLHDRVFRFVQIARDRVNSRFFFVFWLVKWFGTRNIFQCSCEYKIHQFFRFIYVKIHAFPFPFVSPRLPAREYTKNSLQIEEILFRIDRIIYRVFVSIWRAKKRLFSTRGSAEKYCNDLCVQAEILSIQNEPCTGRPKIRPHERRSRCVSRLVDFFSFVSHSSFCTRIFRFLSRFTRLRDFYYDSELFSLFTLTKEFFSPQFFSVFFFFGFVLENISEIDFFVVENDECTT